jgi:hypothetical protein
MRDALKTLGEVIALAALLALCGCASVGIRTVGHQPITVIIGQPTPSPTPCLKNSSLGIMPEGRR